MKEKKLNKVQKLPKVKHSETDKKLIEETIAAIVPMKKERFDNNWCSTLDFLSLKKRNH